MPLGEKLKDSEIRYIIQFKDNLNKLIRYSKEIESQNKNDPMLVYLYLLICKIVICIDTRNYYCLKANNIFKYHQNNEDTLLSNFEWSELEPYLFDINEILFNPIYYINSKIKFTTGRCHLEIDDQLLYRYSVKKHIGKGTYSNVYKCHDHKRCTDVAIKCIRNDYKFKMSGERELKYLKKLNHMNICNYIKYFQLEKHTFIVFPLLKQNLYSELRKNRFTPFHPEQVKIAMRQIIDVLIYIKSVNVIHADLKPENILVENIIYPSNEDNTIKPTLEIKVCDFGSALSKNTTFTGYIQSRYYRAPEINMEQYKCCDYPIDMWSAGCIMYEMLTGFPLFGSKTFKKLIYDIYCELGYPCNEFLYKCKKKDLLLSQIYVSDDIVPYNKLSKIKDIDEEAYYFLVKTFKWLKKDRLLCNEAVTHTYLQN